MVKARTNAGTRGVLRKKLFRDMGGSFMQFLAMFLLCALGTWVFTGLDAAWRMQDVTIESYIEDQNLADFWVQGSSFSKQDISRMRNVRGVSDLQARITLEADCPDLDGKVTAAVHAVQGKMTINTPVIREGEMLSPSDTRGCMVEEQFASAQGLEVGDTLTLEVNDVRYTFIVRALVLSPEYLLTVKDMSPDPATYGFVLLSAEALPAYPFTEAVIDLQDGADGDAAREAIEDAVPGAFVITQKTHSATVSAREYPRLFRNMSYLFPVLAYFVAILVVVTTISRMVDTQRTQMGTLKALGYTDRQIRRHYLSYALVPSLTGSAVGLVLAQFTLPQIIWRMVATNVRVPEVLMAPISPISWFMSALEVVVSLFICYRHVNRKLKETTAELLRPKPPKSGARIFLERITPLWNRFSFNTKMVARNIFRNKGRTFMSVIGLLFCNMLIICSFGLQESLPHFVEDYFSGTLAYDTYLELESGTEGTEAGYRARIDAETVDTVMDVAVTMESSANKRSALITVFPEDLTLIRLGEDHTVMDLPEDGLVLTVKMAEMMNVSAGDKITFTIAGDTDEIETFVAEIANINLGLNAYMGEAAWNRLHKGDFTPTAILVKNLTALGETQVDAMDEVTSVKHPASQQKQTLRILDSASMAFSVLSGVALGLAFVICYNMGLLNFTERTRDYATLKVLGYHQKEIRRLMMRENNVTAIIGVLAGILPGILLIKIILKMCEFESMVFVMYVTWPTVALSSLVSYLFATLIGAFLTRKVRSIDMVEALKSVE